MGEYTDQYMAENFAVGNVADYGPSWWAAGKSDLQSLHFDGSIPLDVARRMVGWQPIQVPMLYTDPATGITLPFGTTDDAGNYDGPMVVIRPGHGPIGFNGGGTNHANLWEWFIDGPATLLETSAGDLSLGFIGLFKNGAVCAVQVDLTKTVTDSVTGVESRHFLYAALALDGSMRPQMGRGRTRMVCDNTFRMGQSEAGKSGMLYTPGKQTKNFKVNWADARAVLDILTADAEAEIARDRRMCEFRVTNQEWFAFLDAWIPVKDDKGEDLTGRTLSIRENKRDALSHLWHNDVRVAPWRNTAFGVSQAVTTFGQHLATVKGVKGNRIERHRLNMIQGKSTGEEIAALETLQTIVGPDRPIFADASGTVRPGQFNA